jgi:hypothetical protein
LTSYHVLRASGQEDIESNAHALKLSFGYLTNDPGFESSTFNLIDEQPIVSWSPVHKLDYVLLQVADKAEALEAITPLPFTHTSPEERSGLYILQHPQGEPMKLAIDANGITSVCQDTARIQYVTRASPGSSGSPCFNENWKVLALHHAERSRGFGTIREGIMFDRIYDNIKSYIT